MLIAFGTVQIRSGIRPVSGARVVTPVAGTPVVGPSVPARSPSAAASGALLFGALLFGALLFGALLFGALLFPATARAPLFVVHTRGRPYPEPSAPPAARLAALAVR
ncbi:MAG: hypothetical protein ACRDND_24180 [Streptosporangiaceae bacterium]